MVHAWRRLQLEGRVLSVRKYAHDVEAGRYSLQASAPASASAITETARSVTGSALPGEALPRQHNEAAGQLNVKRT